MKLPGFGQKKDRIHGREGRVRGGLTVYLPDGEWSALEQKRGKKLDGKAEKPGKHRKN